MNRLRLEPRLDHEPHWPDGVWLALFVDGIELTNRAWPSLIDLDQLQASVARDGEYAIFTCECGEANCAGIEEPVRVRHDAGGVRWWLGDAWRFIGCAPGVGADWETQVRTAAGGAAAGAPRELCFAAEHYAAAIAQDIAGARAFVARLDRFVTFTPEANAAALKYPDLPPAAAAQRQQEALAAWRAMHPLPPEALSRRRLPPATG